MTEEKERVLPERRRVRDDEVERIPWREFVRSQFRKVAGFIALVVVLFAIIQLSRLISPDVNEINPDGVLSLSTRNHILLMVVSSFLFISVLGVFTKVVLIDHRDEFGITSWRQPRVAVTFLLTTSFISLVYILLDISLINIYLMTLPTWFLSVTQPLVPAAESLFPDSLDRLSYSQLRGYLFIALLGFLFIFPLTMFVSLLTRFGRRTIKKQREKEKRLPVPKLIFGLVASGAMAAACFAIYANAGEVASAIFFFIGLGFICSAAFFLLMLLFNLVRFTVFLTYSNFLLIFPFIFLFYLLPAGLWGLWDVLVIVTTGGFDNTIYSLLPSMTPGIDPSVTDFSSLGGSDIGRFYLQTVGFNLRSVIRIIQLDFILVVGFSALVIGFAEGYSILAIFRGIAQGVSITRTGRVATRSAPEIVVITSRLFYLGAWLSFFWDNLVVLGRAMSESVNFSVDFFELPQFLNIVVDFSLSLSGISDTLLVLTILSVPFYFILTSSFKFLSVSLALEKVGEDRQLYYLLISSAYILIVTNIFADIASLPDFVGDHKQFLPLAGAATEDFLPFVAKIFEIIGSMAFYAGVVATIVVTVRSRLIGETESGAPEDTESSGQEAADPIVEVSTDGDEPSRNDTEEPDSIAGVDTKDEFPF